MTEESLKTKNEAPVLLAPDPVRLVASARFIVETLVLPPGISQRDTPGFLEGEIEERSLFPLESTSWGYIETRGRSTQSSIVLFSAFRDQVNGATDPHYAQRHAVLPGFAVLMGRACRKATWLTLQEPECVTLVRIAARSGIPDWVRSRYTNGIEEDPQAAWAFREELIEAADIPDDEHIEDGLVRCCRSSIDRKGGVVFQLERCRTSGESWKRFGSGKILTETTLLAADVRDSHFLTQVRNRRRAARQLHAFLRIAAVLVVGLTMFQFRYIQLKKNTARLTERLSAQRPIVEALQQQEALAKTAGRLSDAPLEIFAWLTAVNEVRPGAISFQSAYADRDGQLGFSGEAPSVAAVNQFRDGLNHTNSFRKVETKEINSAKSGVRFTIQVRMNPEINLQKGDET